MRPSFKNVQDAVEKRTKQFAPKQYFPLEEIFLKITEETWEVAKEISRLYAHKRKKGKGSMEHLKLEIGDMLFALCCLWNSQGIDYQKIMDEVDEKDFECTPDESPIRLFNAVAQQVHAVMAEISHIMNFNYSTLKTNWLKEKIKLALLSTCRLGNSQGIDLNNAVADAIKKFEILDKNGWIK